MKSNSISIQEIHCSHLREIINKGVETEQIVLKYADTLITAMNTRDKQIENVVPDPHPCFLNTNNISKENMDQDYADLINCCQRHVCRLNGYCKSVKFGANVCRFGYPFKLRRN
jgi:hypothetical protein